jgi:hypothetical protein
MTLFKVIKIICVTHMKVMFPNLILGSPGLTVKSYVERMSHPPCDDKYLFFTFSGGGATVGSASGASVVMSYSLNNGGTRFFVEKLNYEHSNSFARI